MDKFLKAEFFKSLGFSTKTDGIAFIKTIPKLSKRFNDFDVEIVRIREQKLEEFEEEMEKYSDEMKSFIKECKARNKNKTNEKKAKLRDEEIARIKQEARDEIIKESLSEKYSKFMISYSPEQICSLADMSKTMSSFVKDLDNGSLVLEPEVKDTIVNLIGLVNGQLKELFRLKSGMEKLQLLKKN